MQAFICNRAMAKIRKRLLSSHQRVLPLTTRFSAHAMVPSSKNGANTCKGRESFLIPFQRDPHFVGRKDLIAKIKAKLEVQPRVALAGIGGVR